MNCPRCGAVLGDADLQSPNCRYCGAVHPHMARAAEKVEVVKQLLAPGPGGMPVAMAAMMGHTGPAPHPAPGPYGSGVIVVNGVVVQSGHAPPQMGGPVGGFGMNPYAAPPFAHVQQSVHRHMRGVVIAAAVGALVVMLVVGVVVALVVAG